MSDRGPINPANLFHMGTGDFLNTWGLTPEELRRECAAGRLVAHGKQTEPGHFVEVRFYFPAMRDWIARKRKMPQAVRTKVEAAGGLDRLEQFRMDQIRRCRFDILANTMTLPDGEVLHDMRIQRATRQ
jgi:hypothetical protein